MRRQDKPRRTTCTRDTGVVQRPAIGTDVGVDQDRAEQDEVPESRMDDVAVDAHDTETGCNGDRFVGHHPDSAWEAVHFHREGRRWVQRPVPAILQDASDLARGFIEDFAAAMKLLICHTARRRSDVLTIHLDHQGDIAARPGQRLLHMRDFRGQRGVVDGGERDVVGSRGQQTDLSQSASMTSFRLGRSTPSARTFCTVGCSARRRGSFGVTLDIVDYTQMIGSTLAENLLSDNASRRSSGRVDPPFLKRSAPARWSGL